MQAVITRVRSNSLTFSERGLRARPRALGRSNLTCTRVGGDCRWIVGPRFPPLSPTHQPTPHATSSTTFTLAFPCRHPWHPCHLPVFVIEADVGVLLIPKDVVILALQVFVVLVVGAHAHVARNNCIGSFARRTSRRPCTPSPNYLAVLGTHDEYATSATYCMSHVKADSMAALETWILDRRSPAPAPASTEQRHAATSSSEHARKHVLEISGDATSTLHAWSTFHVS